MDVFNTFATDLNAEVEGVWFSLSKTASVKLARASNDRFNAALRKAMEKFQPELEGNDEATAAASDKIMIDLMAETILLDWKGLQFKGKDVPYSAEMARTMLAVKDFRKRITQLSESFEAFKVKAEEAQGNG